MAEFKVGDRVKLISGTEVGAKIGALATVVDYLPNNTYVKVKWDRDPLWRGVPDGVYHRIIFKIVTPKPSPVSAQVDAINEEYGPVVAAATTNPAIVCLIKDGRPLPSKQPFVHASLPAAAKEADRLASKHLGEKFGVYVLAETKQIAIPAALFKVGDLVSVRRAFGRTDKVKTAAFINGRWGYTLHKMKGFYFDDDIGEVKCEHAWQLLAQTGQRGAAIRIIHKKTGLPLEYARLAVNSWADAMMIGRT